MLNSRDSTYVGLIEKFVIKPLNAMVLVLKKKIYNLGCLYITKHLRKELVCSYFNRT